MKLSREITQQYQMSKRVFDEFSEQIEDRIDEILRFLCATFGNSNTKLDTWWFPDAKEGEVGTLIADLTNDDDSIKFTWEGRGLSSVEDVLYGSGGGGVLVKFLFMDNDNIAKFIQDEIKAEEERKREAAMKRKKKKAQAKKSALSKLTTDEKKALGIKIIKTLAGENQNE